MMTREELRANVDGIAFMTVTPFHENGEVDYDGYRFQWRISPPDGR